MARGILFADAINTVSPSYAQEIQTGEFGEGLDPILRMRAYRLRGILNGIDYARRIPRLTLHWQARLMLTIWTRGRLTSARCKSSADLDEADVPLLAVISRLNENKGFDLVLAGASKPILATGAQLVVMGAGMICIRTRSKRWKRNTRGRSAFSRRLTNRCGGRLWRAAIFC